MMLNNLSAPTGESGGNNVNKGSHYLKHAERPMNEVLESLPWLKQIIFWSMSSDIYKNKNW